MKNSPQQHSWHPLALAVYPVLALLAYNAAEVRPQAALRALLISLGATTVLWLLLRFICRDGSRAAFAASLVVVLFFAYGHVYDLIDRKWEIPCLPAAMPLLWSALTGVGMVRVLRPRTRVREAAAALNVVSLGLASFAALQVVWWSLPRTVSGPAADFAPLQELRLAEGQMPPDIYYIIVDSYGRSDLLLEAFDYDNSDFIRRLRDLGFYVADCAQSNYNRTDVSLASSLNMQYLQALDRDFRPGNQGRRTLWESIAHSAVRANLENAGYNTVAFATGFAWSEIRDADVYFAPSLLWSEMSTFETLLLRSTPLRHLQDLGWLDFDQIDGERYRQRTELVFENMADLAHMPGPKFVFIHIIPPHPPFVYGRTGRPLDPEVFLNEDRRYTYASYALGYRTQVEYVTGQVEAAIETLLAESAAPPVIILQGDHAPWLQSGHRKFLVLSAYYLPDHGDLPYPTISPVNTFRLVFNTYFDTDYELLPDISYYSPVPNIYEFEQFPNPCLDP